jgi:hypothetical protein
MTSLQSKSLHQLWIKHDAHTKIGQMGTFYSTVGDCIPGSYDV